MVILPNTGAILESIFNSHSAYSKDSLDGRLLAGYGTNLQNFYLGSELFASISPTHMTVHGTGGETGSSIDGVLQEEVLTQPLLKVQQKPLEGGVDLRPGLFLTQTTLLYGRVGVAVNQINVMVDNATTTDFLPPFFPENASFPIELSASTSKVLTALRLGLGLEQFITKNLAIRADYIHTQYPAIELSNRMQRDITEFDPFIGSGTATAIAHAKVQLRNNTVLFGLSYYFH